MIELPMQEYVRMAKECTADSIGEIMLHLNAEMTIAESKFIDYALSLIESPEGMKIMEHYLFNGTQIQSNYCALYFARRHEHLLVTEAFKRGCIDGTQYKAMGVYG